LTGETAALVTYALLSIILGYYSFSRISTLFRLKRQISAKKAQDADE
jgi:hypothetical protein|tara:strand:- start:107 stop:247 length:141 start_codon:yes stop_codon:yes gene_type:complete